MSENITYREIYDRLVAVESKVDALKKDAKTLEDVKTAFEAAQGAFKVLETLSKLAKPLLWVGGLFMAAMAIWDHFRVR
jgi:hypothetical protein